MTFLRHPGRGRDSFHGDRTGRFTPAADVDGTPLRVATFDEAEHNLTTFREEARLLYQGAGYVCTACRIVFDVACPKCKRPNPAEHGEDLGAQPVRLRSPMITSRAHGKVWAVVECWACGQRFRVMVR